MPKYLLKASYTAEGAQGLLQEGGTKRRQAAEAALKSLGATMESFYFAFGATDVFVLADAADHATASAASLAITASGAVRVETVVLITPEELDQLTQKKAQYRAPGR
jgi:uncharacterized protein with GYD domain